MKTKLIDYTLQAFGYLNIGDFQATTFKMFYITNYKILLACSITLGTIREFIELGMGLDILVIACFVFLIVAEWQTGLKVDIIKRKRKFKSRKFGRMILKIGVYITILFVLHTLQDRTKSTSILGASFNPFEWLYYIVFMAITLQLVISWFENLGHLGYKEARGLVGIILRKANKWFEFDGEKDGDVFKE